MTLASTTSAPLPVGPVTCQVTVNGQVPVITVLDAQLDQAWGQHDVFTIRAEYQAGTDYSKIALWPDGAPVSVTWGRAPQAPLRTWYGYVNHRELSGNADSGTRALQVRYVLIGMSQPMNTDVSQSWGQVTPTYVAKKLAAKHGMRCVVTSADWLLPGEIQAAESDFAFASRVAAKTGYRFWASSGTLYMVDPAVLLAGAASASVPVFRQDKDPSWQDTLRDFTAWQGSGLPGAQAATRAVYGIDSATGRVFAATAGSGPLVRAQTARVATSYAEGRQVAAAWQNLAQFWTGATAETFGSTALYPGKTVNLAGDALPGGNAGYWIVSAASHVLKLSGTTAPTADSYVTQVEMLRNTGGPVPAFSGVTAVTPETVPCWLAAGTWRAASQPVIYDGVITS